MVTRSTECHDGWPVSPLTLLLGIVSSCIASSSLHHRKELSTICFESCTATLALQEAVLLVAWLAAQSMLCLLPRPFCPKAGTLANFRTCVRKTGGLGFRRCVCHQIRWCPPKQPLQGCHPCCRLRVQQNHHRVYPCFAVWQSRPLHQSQLRWTACAPLTPAPWNQPQQPPPKATTDKLGAAAAPC